MKEFIKKNATTPVPKAHFTGWNNKITKKICTLFTYL